MIDRERKEFGFNLTDFTLRQNAFSRTRSSITQSRAPTLAETSAGESGNTIDKVQPLMTPPSSLVITTTEGRGRLLSLSAGQRSRDWHSRILARVLDGDKERFAIRGKFRSAEFRAGRRVEEVLG